MFSIMEECLTVSAHLQPYVTNIQLFLQVSELRAELSQALHQGPGDWLFICLAHQRLVLTWHCPVRTSEKAFPCPPCLTGQADVRVRSVSHCVT